MWTHIHTKAQAHAHIPLLYLQTRHTIPFWSSFPLTCVCLVSFGSSEAPFSPHWSTKVLEFGVLSAFVGQPPLQSPVEMLNGAEASGVAHLGAFLGEVLAVHPHCSFSHLCTVACSMHKLQPILFSELSLCQPLSPQIVIYLLFSIEDTPESHLGSLMEAVLCLCTCTSDS